MTTIATFDINVKALNAVSFATRRGQEGYLSHVIMTLVEDEAVRYFATDGARIHVAIDRNPDIDFVAYLKEKNAFLIDFENLFKCRDSVFGEIDIVGVEVKEDVLILKTQDSYHIKMASGFRQHALTQVAENSIARNISKFEINEYDNPSIIDSEYMTDLSKAIAIIEGSVKQPRQSVKSFLENNPGLPLKGYKGIFTNPSSLAETDLTFMAMITPKNLNFDNYDIDFSKNFIGAFI